VHHISARAAPRRLHSGLCLGQSAFWHAVPQYCTERHPLQSCSLQLVTVTTPHVPARHPLQSGSLQSFAFAVIPHIAHARMVRSACGGRSVPSRDPPLPSPSDLPFACSGSGLTRAAPEVSSPSLRGLLPESEVFPALGFGRLAWLGAGFLGRRRGVDPSVGAPAISKGAAEE
jgi:hypothetical protein